MADKARQPHVLSSEFTRILCISAHPDDNEFSIAGSVARWAREGRDVVFCLVTTGGSGTNEHTPDNTGLIPIRERESWDAAKILGVKDLVFLGYQDGVIEPTIALRRDLTRVIRRVKPHVVLCGDPTVRWYGNEYLNHPDHRAVGFATFVRLADIPDAQRIAIEVLAGEDRLALHVVEASARAVEAGRRDAEARREKRRWLRITKSCSMKTGRRPSYRSWRRRMGRSPDVTRQCDAARAIFRPQIPQLRQREQPHGKVMEILAIAVRRLSDADATPTAKNNSSTLPECMIVGRRNRHAAEITQLMR